MKPVMNNMSVVVSRVLQIVVRYFNPFMRLVLGSRAHRMMSGQLMLLSFTGRRTGRSYITPVSYVREGTNLLVPGGGAWWKNLTSGTARVRLQGTWHVVTPEVIREPVALSAVGSNAFHKPSHRGVYRHPAWIRRPAVCKVSRA